MKSPNILLLLVFVGSTCIGCGGGATAPGPAAPSNAAPAAASRATAMSSFEGSEEPTVLYYPATDRFTNDSYVNMTSPSPGVFRFTLRYRARTDGWWDGDRNTNSTDRQRAEVKGLGVHQKNDETFEYGTTWRTTRGGNGKFWHVFQLKATDGDDAPPLIVSSIQSATGAAIRYWPGTASNFIVARSYGFAVDDWTTIAIRVKTSTAAAGEVKASINGDAYAGVSSVAVFRPESTDYRPKWGSYRGVDASEPYGDDFVEHKDVWAGRAAN